MYRIYLKTPLPVTLMVHVSTSFTKRPSFMPYLTSCSSVCLSVCLYGHLTWKQKYPEKKLDLM